MSQQQLIPDEPCYLLDNNIIMELTHPARGFPIAKYPELHKHLERLINEGKVKSVREVKREFEAGQIKNPDPPLAWCEKHESMFVHDELTEQYMAEVAPHFEVDILNMTRPYADPYLVAHSLAHNSIIVTNESSTPNLNKPKIPQIATKLKATHTDIWNFFKQTGLDKYI